MTKRWLDAVLLNISTRPDLRPARALLSPTWLGALAVLGLNDHLWKGGALPGALTGKLSDIAGMIVAPALLAALLGLRSRRGLLYCHIAVGLVFSAINLSPAAADAWSWLMGLVGVPWQITVDPTDLLTLPALALGWRVLTPAMRERAAAPVPKFSRPRPLELGAATLGTLLCVATSRGGGGGEGGEFGDEGGDFGEFGDEGGNTYQPIFADVYLHNSSPDRALTLRVRNLRPDVLVDCFNAEKDPGVLFTDPLFDAGLTYTLPPTTNVPARPADGSAGARECYAVLVESDTLDPTILFWHADSIGETEIPGWHTDAAAYQEGAVVLSVDADGRAAITESVSDLHYPSQAPAADAFLPRPDETRVAWSEPPNGRFQITDLEVGPDGCAAFTFDDGAVPRFYLCTPLTQLPFEPLQYVDVTDLGDLVTLALSPDPNDPQPVPGLQLAVSRGGFLPNITDAVLAAKPRFVDHLGPDPACGTVAQPQQLSVSFGGQIVDLQAGEQQSLDDGTHTLTLHAVHAERRLILDPICAEGPDQLGDDLEIVALWQQNP